MSRCSKEMITCPDCGKESDFILWDSINTMLNPELKEKLMNGELFRFTCPDCGYKANVNYPILYHQMEDNLMIYYVTSEKEIDKVTDIMLGMDEPTADFVGDIMEKYTKRITTTIPALLEKINIFSNGLDDRIIEILKLFYYHSMEDKDKDILRELRFCVEESGDMIFVFFSDEGAFASAKFDKKIYDHLSEKYSEKFAAYENDLIIDLNWALKMLK